MNIRIVDNLSGREFEILIKSFLGSLGFVGLKATKASGDYGVDLLGEFKGKLVAVQAKRHGRRIGIKSVQEAFSGKTYYKADRCMVVSNQEYTEAAFALAERCECWLIDRSDIEKWLAGNFRSSDDFLQFIQNRKIKRFRIPSDLLIEEYRRLQKHLGRQPRIEDIEQCSIYSSSVYRKRWGSWNNFLRSIGETPLQEKNLSKATLIENYKQVKRTLGKVPTAHEIKKYCQYSVSTYSRAFGSWNRFVELQGDVPPKRHLIPKQEFIEEFKRVKAQLGRVPTIKEMATIGKIAPTTYRRLWGSWTNFLKEMGEPYKKRNIPVDELVKAYLKLKKQIRKKSLTQRDMSKYGQFCSSVYERRFGSWNNFLEFIGDLPNRKKITTQDLIDDYFRVKKVLGKPRCSANDIKRHGRFALSTYLKRFGKWNSFLERIGDG